MSHEMQPMTWKDLKAMCKKFKIKDSARISMAIKEKHGETCGFMPVVRFGIGDECPREDILLGTPVPITINFELYCEELERELSELRTRLANLAPPDLVDSKSAKKRGK
jgi:hypothetical protein